MIGLTVAMFYENVTIQFSIDVLVKPRDLIPCCKRRGCKKERSKVISSSMVGQIELLETSAFTNV